MRLDPFQPTEIDPRATLAKRLPSWGASIVKALVRVLWRWYWSLGLVGMFLATAAAGAALWLGVAELPFSESNQAELRGLVGAALVPALLLVLVTGMLRGGRRR